MPTEINVRYFERGSTEDPAMRLRYMLTDICKTTRERGDSYYNPLHETNFNEVLAEALQKAFDEGREFERMRGKYLG